MNILHFYQVNFNRLYMEKIDCMGKNRFASNKKHIDFQLLFIILFWRIETALSF